MVPVSLPMPTGFMSPCGTPRANSCWYTFPSRSTVGDEPLRERVDHRDADAVQAAGDLVALAAELSAGVELRQDDGETGQARAFHDVDRDAAAAVDAR